MLWLRIIILIYLHVRISPLSFHFIIICDQRSVPTASRPDCPSTLASKKQGKYWENVHVFQNIMPRIIRQQIGSWNYFNVSFALPISDVIVAGKVPHVANVLKFAHCIASRNAMICSDLFYILFFFSILLVVAKLFYSEREFQGKYFLPLPQCCFYPTHLLVYFIICFLVAFCISVL